MINNLKIRNIKIKDIKSILKIYNYYIFNGLGNFEEKLISYKEFSIFCRNIIELNLPFLICEDSKKLIGFTYLNKFRNKSGYKYSFENSIYVHNEFKGIGVGNLLLSELIKISKKNINIKTIIAVIGNDNNSASINIHKKNGFKLVGTLRKVGYKKNLWLDAVYMQRMIND